MNSTSLDALRQSLIELSKSNTVHYESVLQELSNTRLAILKIEGVDIDELVNYEKKFKQISTLNKEIDNLTEKAEHLSVLLACKERDLRGLNEKIETAQRKLTEVEVIAPETIVSD